MSGLYGHIHHIYDDLTLTFCDLKNIYHQLIFDKIELHEKTDGQNIFFSYNVVQKKVLFSRNKTNIKNGGMTLPDILDKWSKNEKVLSSFELAYNVLNLKLNDLSTKNLTDIFGDSNQNWFSAEIINKLNPNVLHYNRNLIILHETCFTFDNNGNKLCNPEKTINDLDCIIGKTKYGDWEIWKPVICKLNLANKTELFTKHVDELQIFMKKYNLNDCDTIGNFVVNMCPDYNQKSKKNKFDIEKNILQPLEDLTFNFSCDVLQNQKSLICYDPFLEIKRLRFVIKNEINEILSVNNAKDVNVVNKQIKRLNNLNNIDCSMEGITFYYKNKIYKITGYFSPINAIMGIRRYIE